MADEAKDSTVRSAGLSGKRDSGTDQARPAKASKSVADQPLAATEAAKVTQLEDPRPTTTNASKSTQVEDPQEAKHQFSQHLHNCPNGVCQIDASAKPTRLCPEGAMLYRKMAEDAFEVNADGGVLWSPNPTAAA